VVAIGRVGPHAGPAVPALDAILRVKYSTADWGFGKVVSESVLPFALAAMGRAEAVDNLLAALRNPNPLVRFWAAKALGSSGANGAVTVRGLVERLGDHEWPIRAQSAESLGEHRLAGQALRPLVAALSDANWEVSRAARLALVAVGDRAAPELARVLKEKAAPNRARIHAAAALLALGQEESLARSVLTECLRSDHERLRAEAAEVLGDLGAKAASLLDALEAVRTTDPQLWVRVIAAGASDAIRRAVTP
jgi:HEAT repeat protein